MFMHAVPIRLRHNISLQAAQKNSADYPTVLDVIVPTSLDALWNFLSDTTHTGLFIQLHQALESENFSIQIASPLSTHKLPVSPLEEEEDIHLVLTFTTPLPLLSLRAQNTEKLHMQRGNSSFHSNSFSILSTCSTMGVPLGNCFLNKLEWHAEAIGVNATHLTIKAHTEFIVPVLGVLRSQIERESFKGIQNSYKIFENVLKEQQWNGSTSAATEEAIPGSQPSAVVSNLKKSSAMSTARFRQKKAKNNNTLGSTSPLAANADALPQDRKDVEKGEEKEAKFVEKGKDEADQDIEEEEEEEEEDQPLETSKRPHKQAYFHFRGKTFNEIKTLATEKWPTWEDNRFWLLKSGSHGGSEMVSSCPTPDEAVGIMWAIVAYVSSRKPGTPVPSTVSRDPLFKGLIECLRVAKARTPPQGTPRILRGGGGRAGAGGRSGGRGGRGAGGRGGKGRKNSKTAENTTTTTTTSAAVTATSEAAACPPVLSNSSISSAIFCIGYMETESEWSKEIDALCSLIPIAEFFKVIDVYNVIWSLRSSRHWTPHLPILEAAVVGLLKDLEDNEWSTRQMRHASYCAQGLVHFGHVPKELLSLLAPRVLKNWDWRAACSLAWALTISNELDSPLVPIVFKGIQENADDALQNGFHKHVALSKIWQLLASLDQMRPGSLSKKTWDTNMRRVIDLAQAHWQELVHEETKVTSGVQKEVYRSMMSMGYTADLECAVCGLSIDVAVQKIKLAVEVDGFSHFARNRPNQAVGNSLWKKRFLEANGWLAVNINVKDWYNKRGAGEKREFLKEAIAHEEEKKKVKDAARLKRKKYWRTSFPRTRARHAAAKKMAIAAKSSTVAAT
ncbi:hypothetical protein Ndes2437A_g04507 [Nannochloris sp. 'desiccata']